MMNYTTKPELLCPAGDMERLTYVLNYGADAVYLAGKAFGMRAAAGNFTIEEMKEAISLAKCFNAKVYVTVNTLPREYELEDMKNYLSELEVLKPDGLIIADLGVFCLAKEYAPSLELHVSTQLGVVNSATANFLHSMGAKRVVLARELTMEQIKEIRKNTPPELELEAFVHGAMCVSFSGRCLLSNYLTDRDANAGACAQPCRWKYHLIEEKRPGEYFEITEDGGTHIMNSRDMCMIEHIDELLDAGISSLKIEGRMKSTYYAAVSTYAYRHALDDALNGKSFNPLWLDECNKLSHRPYSTGFYYGYPGQHSANNLYYSDADVCAVVMEKCDDSGMYMLSQRNKFSVGDKLELIAPDILPVPFSPEELFDEYGNEITSTPCAMMKFRMKLPVDCGRFGLVRKLKDK